LSQRIRNLLRSVSAAINPKKVHLAG
jgi:hypothetical protein